MFTKNKMKKTIVIFHYSQSGQTLDIARRIAIPLENGENEIIYKAIEPEKPFPFPWSCWEFFESFPESRLGIPTCKLKEINLSDVENADLVIIAGPLWYLSPSIPLHAFFQDEKIKAYLKGKNIVNIFGCRNMWVMAQKKMREYIGEAGGNYAGNIVLQDKGPNLISVLTIARWLLKNQKAASRWLPAAGVSDEDIEASSRFGIIIKEVLESGEWNSLQEKLMQAHAVEYKPSLAFLEKAAHRTFGLWANFIRKKGGYQDKNRSFRVRLFCCYIFFVLYAVSPFVLVLFYLAYPFCLKSIKKHKHEMCYKLD